MSEKKNSTPDEPGSVGILISPGYGAGWSTVHTNVPHREVLSMHPRLVAAVAEARSKGEIEAIAKEVTGNDEIYMGGAENLEVKTLPRGTPFIIHEYHGSETLVSSLGDLEEVMVAGLDIRSALSPGFSEWAGLQGLPDHMLVAMNYWALFDYVHPGRKHSEPPTDPAQAISRAIVAEGERRGWPDGWWEDPSVIPGLDGGDPEHSGATSGTKPSDLLGYG